jgi:hypothetical protein
VEQRLRVLGDYMQRLELQPMQVVEAMLQMVARDVPCDCGYDPTRIPVVEDPTLMDGAWVMVADERIRVRHSDYCNRWGALVRARECVERVADEWLGSRMTSFSNTAVSTLSAESLAAARQHMEDYLQKQQKPFIMVDADTEVTMREMAEWVMRDAQPPREEGPPQSAEELIARKKRTRREERRRSKREARRMWRDGLRGKR